MDIEVLKKIMSMILENVPKKVKDKREKLFQFPS